MATGCSEPQCPAGYEKRENACFRVKDADPDDGSEDLDGAVETVVTRDGSDESSPMDASTGPGAPDAGVVGAAPGDAAGIEAGPGPVDAASAAPTMDASACSDSSCPQCDEGRPCTGAHELCVGNKCVVQPYCGDGKKGADEECDPMHPSWNAWTCSSKCRLTTAYSPCGKATRPGDPQGICSVGEFCVVACTPSCSVAGDCPAAPGDAGLVPICYADVWGGCMLTECKRSADCPPGLVCLPATTTLNFTKCGECTGQYPCPAGQTCRLASGDDMFKRCI